MKKLILIMMLAFGLSSAAQDYCVVGTGRLVAGDVSSFSHSAVFADSTVDLSKRIEKPLISLADVVFYFTLRGWELVTLNQMNQAGEYFILVFRRD